MSESMRYDLVIVGGGLVGASLAVALRNTSLRLALIEARMPDPSDPRLFALNDSSCAMLKKLGVWEAINQDATPIKNVHVSSQGSFGAVRLKHDDVGLAALGCVVPANRIEVALNTLLENQENIDLFRPAMLKDLEQLPTQDGYGVTLTLCMDGEDISLYAPFVIGADGTSSTVRELLGISAETTDYGQKAIVTRTRLKRSHEQVAYERFTATGAIAMLPLVDNECATIWTADQAHADELLAFTDDEFVSALQAAFGYRLGRLCGIGKRYTFPLKMIRAQECVNGGVLLLGNASHTLHPVAAQGFNLALYEVAVLAEALHSGGKLDLARISELIHAQMNVSMSASHRLAGLFNHTSSLVRALIPLGMLGFDKITPIKRRFINRLMGRSGNVPALLRISV